jgi:hypothetical protein
MRPRARIDLQQGEVILATLVGGTSNDLMEPYRLGSSSFSVVDTSYPVG